MGLNRSSGYFILNPVSFSPPRLALPITSCTCGQMAMHISTWEVPEDKSLRSSLRKESTLGVLLGSIQRELGTTETQSKGLIQFRKMEALGGAGQAFNLAEVTGSRCLEMRDYKVCRRKSVDKPEISNKAKRESVLSGSLRHFLMC